MDIAIVTGAETPLGLRIVQTLIQQGCRVHGIGNNFSKVTYGDPQFKAHAIDLSDLDAVASTLGRILEEEQRLDLLVHAIDVTPGTPFEKLPAGNLEAILKIGLLGPVMMTRLALPNLLRFRGQLINLVTANKHGHPGSAANALIEGGLREMNRALFDRSRDAGLRVTNCMLRQNAELCDGSVSDDALAQSHISLDDVARAIEQLVDPNAVNVPGEIVLYPRLSSAAGEALPETPLPLDPYSAVVLPPKAYRPPEEAKIPTQQKQPVERTIPYSDEEMEEKIAAAIEDFEAHPERYDRPDPAPVKQQQGGPKRNNSPQNGPQQEGQGKNKRRRRRGGRNRNKKPQDGDGPKRENTVAPQQQKEAESQAPPKKPGPEPSVKDKSAAEPKPKEANESPRQNPEAGSKKKTVLKPDKASPDAAAKAPASPAPGKDLTKKPVKKAAKKAAKKTAKKKTAAKKAAKKKTVKKKAVRKVAE
ncbi:MAG: SDR family NAD(P)-dependent oxidoreductase [Opitutales bacterium]